MSYVALGDSYTSAPLVPVTDVADGCFRSSNNYPALAARKLDATLEDRSCGAAETKDLVASQYAGVAPQLSALGAGTDLVTIGIGGNDGGVFNQLVNRCPQLRAQDPAGAPCARDMDAGGEDRLLGILARTAPQVTQALREVQRRSPDAKVLVVGYPEIITADETCPELPLARGDYAYAARINRAMVTMLRESAEATGATYVDVFTASRPRHLPDDPSFNGSVTDQKRAAAYHPFAAEQAAVADLVVAAAQG